MVWRLRLCPLTHSLICGFSAEGTSTSGSAVLTARNVVGGVYFNPQCLASSAATWPSELHWPLVTAAT